MGSTTFVWHGFFSDGIKYAFEVGEPFAANEGLPGEGGRLVSVHVSGASSSRVITPPGSGECREYQIRAKPDQFAGLFHHLKKVE